MAEKLLDSSAVSVFCGSVATMLGAGLQIDEGLAMLVDGQGASRFDDVCAHVYRACMDGTLLSDAMAGSGGFPSYAVDMVRNGEATGQLEDTLRGLEQFYDEESRMFAKVRSALGYPAALLCILTAILAFTVVVVLPVFGDVYASMTGGLTGASQLSVHVATAIGWVALGFVALLAVVALVLVSSTRTVAGQRRIIRLFERWHPTRAAMEQMSRARFTSALATYLAAGQTPEDAMMGAAEIVDHKQLRVQVDAARDAMLNLDNPRSLGQALAEQRVLEPLYARLLNVSSVAGAIDESLQQLSETFFADASSQVDQAIGRIEPTLAACVTLAVGATLVAVIIPLIGMMNAIG